MAGQGTPATIALRRAGVPFTVHTYSHDPRTPGYGMQAARALAVDAVRVHKTLIASVDGNLVVAVVPVSHTLDLKALTAAVGGKRGSLAGADEATRATGYVIGGISPFGQRRALPTVLDVAAAEHPTVFVSGGRRGMQVEVAPSDLLALTGGTLARIASDGD